MVKLLNDAAIKEPHSTKNDLLTFKTYATLLTEAAKNTDTPFTFGIIGEWGAGKTSLMRLMETQLKEFMEAKRNGQSDGPSIIIVWFNAWRYHRENNLLAPLATAILRAVEQNKNDLQKLQDRGKVFLNALRGIVAGLKLKVGGGPVELTFDAKNAIERAEALGRPGIQYDSLYEDIYSVMDAIDLGEELRIIVFVDDLDRCLPDAALSVLESIKLLLSQRGFVFVLGLAVSTLESYLEKRYVEDYGAKDFKCNAYLDKVIQLRFEIPNLQRHMDDFINDIAIFLESQIDVDSKQKSLVSTIANFEKYNPRAVIRVVNDLILDVSIFRKRFGEIIDPLFFAVHRILKRRDKELWNELVNNQSACNSLLDWLDGIQTENTTVQKLQQEFGDSELKQLFAKPLDNWLSNETKRRNSADLLNERQQDNFRTLYLLSAPEVDSVIVNSLIDYLRDYGIQVQPHTLSEEKTGKLMEQIGKDAIVGLLLGTNGLPHNCESIAQELVQTFSERLLVIGTQGMSWADLSSTLRYLPDQRRITLGDTVNRADIKPLIERLKR